MNGKGSARRPRQVSRQEYARNWEETFGGSRQRIREAVEAHGIDAINGSADAAHALLAKAIPKVFGLHW